MKCVTCYWFVYLSHIFLQNYEVKMTSLLHLKSWRKLLQVISHNLCLGIRLSENEFILSVSITVSDKMIKV